jgi:hypothetical protein
MTAPPFVVAALLLFGTVAGGQSNPPATAPDDDADLGKYFVFDDPPRFACLFTLFPTILLQHEMELKEFINSGTFLRIRRHYGDLKATDAIFVRAMQLTNNNTAASLFISSIATFEHDMMGTKNSVFAFFLPLTGESDKEFHERVAHLPRRLYPDTPKDSTGDDDKLQHFFGSAFLSFVFESNDAAGRFGMFVEKGERLAIYEGAYDNRDLRADGNGAVYGSALRTNNHLLPSPYFVPDFGALPAQINSQGSEDSEYPEGEAVDMDFEVR